MRPNKPSSFSAKKRPRNNTPENSSFKHSSRPDEHAAPFEKERHEGGHKRPFRKSGRNPEKRPAAKDGTYWLYSEHAALKALENKQRGIVEAYVTGAKEDVFDDLCRQRGIRPQIKSAQEISAVCGPDAVHQGIALRVHRLPDADLAEIARRDGPIMILDQVTDPRNIGAVMRSLAAFNGAGLILPSRQAPEENGAMARAAAGALDQVPFVTGGNLAQIIEKLKKFDRWCIGMDAGGELLHQSSLKERKLVVILGSEGSGMRRLTRESCDAICALPMSDTMESLNVSVAAAITLYELFPKA